MANRNNSQWRINTICQGFIRCQYMRVVETTQCGYGDVWIFRSQLLPIWRFCTSLGHYFLLLRKHLFRTQLSFIVSVKCFMYGIIQRRSTDPTIIVYDVQNDVRMYSEIVISLLVVDCITFPHRMPLIFCRGAHSDRGRWRVCVCARHGTRYVIP